MALAPTAVRPAVAGTPSIDLTRMVRIAENVLVEPFLLWTTPVSSPRTLTFPSFFEKSKG